MKDCVLVVGGGHTYYKIKENGKFVRVVSHEDVGKYKSEYEIEPFAKPAISSRMRAYAAEELALEYLIKGEIPYFAFMEGNDYGEPTGGELMYYFFEKALDGDLNRGFLDEESYTSIVNNCLVEKPGNGFKERFGSHTSLGNLLMVNYLWPNILEEIDQIEVLSNWFHLKRLSILAKRILNKNVEGVSAEELLKERYERRNHKILGSEVTAYFSLGRKKGWRAFLKEIERVPLVWNSNLFNNCYLPRELDVESPEVQKSWRDLQW